jgi:hypothetical protein
MFDSRPQSFTQAGLIHNYMPENQPPFLWTGRNGQSTWAASTVRPLEGYKDIFSICNGVHMSPGFDGHEQNKNQIYTGNPFGGDYFAAHLPPNSIDSLLKYLFIEGGSFSSVDIANTGVGMQVQPSILVSLSKLFRKSDTNSAFIDSAEDIILKRFDGNIRNPQGFFSIGSKQTKEGLLLSDQVGRTLSSLQVDSLQDGELNSITSRMEIVREVFARGLSNVVSTSLGIDSDFDTHSPEDAKQQPLIFTTLVDEIKTFFDYLSTTPLSNQFPKPIIQYTTFMITSEFGRTMRQEGADINNTGTDHNPYGNSVLIGGKGIRGGLVIGETDCRQLDSSQQFVDVSEGHRKVDPGLIKMMGKPLDFSTGKAKDSMPETIDRLNHLTIGSLINTIGTIMHLPENKMHMDGAGEEK